MSVNKVSTVEAIALVLIVVINRLTISLPQAIIMSCGSAALLNVIYICIITLLFVFLSRNCSEDSQVKILLIFPNF